MKFLHLSDIHIGLETHGRINPATGRNTRLEDILKCLDHAVDTAIEECLDVLLMAGDIFHRENPRPTEEIEFARRVLRVMEKAGTRVVIVLGNHDYPSASGRASAVEIFPALDIQGVSIVRKPGLIRVETKSGPVEILCLPWVGRSALISRDEYKSLNSQEIRYEIEKRLISIVRDLAGKTDTSSPTIFLGHVSIRNAKLSGTELDTLSTTEPALSLSELTKDAFQYVALGHIHRFQDLNKGASPPVVYSGSLERVDFTEEKEKKGFVVGEISGEGGDWVTEYRFLETPSRKFITIELLGGEREDIESEVNKIPPGEISGAVVRVRFSMSGPEDKLDEKALKSLLSGAQTVKIEKVFETPKKTVRSKDFSRNMGVLQALDKYIESKPELKNIAGDMKSYAEKLIKDTE
jgi:DNA repair protein SbcD/Mre11